MYVWHVCNKLQKWSQANKWCLRVIALHSKRTWTLRELIVSLHWCRARAVKWARNWKILKILDAMSDLQQYQKLSLSQSSGQKGKPVPGGRPHTQAQCLQREPTAHHWGLPFEKHCEPRPTEGARRCWFCSQQADQRPGSGRPAWTCTNRKAKFSISSEWLPGVSKREPFASGRQNWRRERAVAREQTSTVAQTSISGKRHCKYTGNPWRPAACLFYQPALSVLLFRKDRHPNRLKKAHATLARNVTETTSNFTRGTA